MYQRARQKQSTGKAATPPIFGGEISDPDDKLVSMAARHFNRLKKQGRFANRPYKGCQGSLFTI